MVENYLIVLAHEFRAGEGSFLFQLRLHHQWDKDAFQRLTAAMRTCCEHYQYTQQQLDQWQQESAQLTDEHMADDQVAYEMYEKYQSTMLPRWLADGFWYLSLFVKNWTSHASWEQKRVREPEYFKQAYERLYLLTSWFFSGRPPVKDVEKWWTSTCGAQETEF